MLWIVLLLLLLLWVGVGSLLLFFGSRPVGNEYRRKADRRVAAVGEEVEVTLRLIPPVAIEMVRDHDVVLCLDHSGSMGSGPASQLRQAIRAAENFVRRCPEQIHVGLVAFDHEAEIRCPITGDPRAVLRALGALGPGGATAIDLALDRCAEALPAGRPDVPKTVILLSDGGSGRAAAEAAAARLREGASEVTVLCVGFGPWVQEDLMIAVAGDGERYFHVSDGEALNHLFGFLAAAVSGQMAVSSLVDEGTRAPSPFRLGETGGLYPVGVRAGETTRIIWSVPVMDLHPVALTYRLVPECPGWHAVATADGKATWRMPDGSVRENPGPRGPKVLVLPELLSWAWPLVNPLFCMLFGRFLCPAAAPPAEEKLPVPAALPQPSFPEPLPEPEERPYEATVRPAVVIGLGAAGEWALCRLKDRLCDRGLGSDATVELLAVDVTHHANRAPVRIGSSALTAAERIELPQDLRPYVETLRSGPASPTRAWIPWRSWLSDPQPLHTLRTLAGDRRKARLALLRRPEPVEQRLAAGIERVRREDGRVILVGAAGDPVASGLVAEVAHMVAIHGVSSAAVLIRGEDDEVAGVLALERELARLVAMRGDAVLSDRHEPPVAASKLFDRIVIVEAEGVEPAAAPAPAAELLWDLLAYEEVDRRLPASELRAGEVMGALVGISAHVLPVHHLWTWVRERTLAQAVNGQWLGLEIRGDDFVPPAPAAVDVDRWVDAFWSPAGFARPQNRLLSNARVILKGQNPVAALLDQLPSDALHHEQVSFHCREREGFLAFCEEWCRQLLAAEQAVGRWGLPLLIAAVLRLEEDFRTVLGAVDQMSGNEDFHSLTHLAAELYADQAAILTQLRGEIAPWIVALVGEQTALGATAAAPGREPLCYDVEARRQEAELALRLPDEAVRQAVEARTKEWLDIHVPALLDQLRFELLADSADQRLGLRLRIYEHELEATDDVADALRGALDRYRNAVLSWPLHESLAPQQIAEPRSRCRLGKHSARVYPQIDEVAEERDPFLISALDVRELPLAEAVGVAGASARELPFAWPEEANAERIAQKIRHSELQREPRPFSPAVVHLLRDPGKLHAFLADLAEGRVEAAGSEVRLRRDGNVFRIGSTSDGMAPQEAFDRFEQIVRQVVALDLSLDGEEIPPSSETWSLPPEEAVATVENHPLARAAKASPQWAVWRDVIRGLALDVGGS